MSFTKIMNMNSIIAKNIKFTHMIIIIIIINIIYRTYKALCSQINVLYTKMQSIFMYNYKFTYHDGMYGSLHDF